MTLKLMDIIIEQNTDKVYMKADDYRIDATVRKYCQPVRADKNTMGSADEIIEMRVNTYLKRLYETIINEINRQSALPKILMNPIFKELERTKSLMYQPTLNGIKQGFYAQFYLSQPLDYRSFAGGLIDLLLDNVTNLIIKYLNNPAIKGVIKIMSKQGKFNVQEMIDGINMMYDVYVKEVESFFSKLITSISYRGGLRIEPTGGLRCKNVIINVDGNNVKLPPEKQYNPFVPIQINPNYMINKTINWGQFLTPYKSKIISVSQELSKSLK